SGAGALAEGSQSAADGAATLESGAGELTSGAAELANSVKGMDQTVIDELQDAIDEKLGGNFEPHSFVAPGNTNVDTVQFVYVLEGISEPDDENDEDAAEEVDAASTEEAEGEQSFIDRLLALFGN
ncbi:MAG: hypothetical protein Q4C41_09000, partial [Eggerthellaceae bacterium]|nr:hypothetical protein [Eggerthellaceae bacterium]